MISVPIDVLTRCTSVLSTVAYKLSWHATSFLSHQQFRDCVFFALSHFDMASIKSKKFVWSLASNFGKTAAEIHRVLRQAYGDEILSKLISYEWYKYFQSGSTSTDDDEKSCRPSSGNETFIAQVRESFEKTVDWLSEKWRKSPTSCDFNRRLRNVSRSQWSLCKGSWLKSRTFDAFQFAKISYNKGMRMDISCKTSSPKRIFEFVGMTLKHNDCHHNGNVLIRRAAGEKKHGVGVWK
jgi:hypothetical protein